MIRIALVLCGLALAACSQQQAQQTDSALVCAGQVDQSVAAGGSNATKAVNAAGTAAGSAACNAAIAP